VCGRPGRSSVASDAGGCPLRLRRAAADRTLLPNAHATEGGGVERKPVAVFDLDGTLADTRHRLHFVESTPKDWSAFFRAADQDPPLAEGIALALEWAERCDLAYVTGRPERCRRATERWLADQGLPRGTLSMRSPRDFRPARVAKPGLLRELAREREVAVVVDDDVQVCDAYRQAGFEVVVADWMPPAESLHHAQEDTGRT
jgi:phosphoglycolate phosphatase-like HAD superfamily hydrolase